MHMQVKADYTKHVWHKTRYGQLSEGNHGHCGIQMTDHAYGLFLDQELVPCPTHLVVVVLVVGRCFSKKLKVPTFQIGRG